MEAEYKPILLLVKRSALWSWGIGSVECGREGYLSLSPHFSPSFVL